MTAMDSIQEIIDRIAISDVVILYAAAADRRDWKLFRSIFTDRIKLDFTSFNPDLSGEWDADDWVGIGRRLEGFDSTQHISTNHAHHIGGNEARCVSYGQACHFLTRDGTTYHCILHGYYTNLLRRTVDGWKIHSCQYDVTAMHGDPRIFEWANLR